jgi:hypothetical protein
MFFNSITKDVLHLNTTFADEQLALWFKNRTGVSAGLVHRD